VVQWFQATLRFDDLHLVTLAYAVAYLDRFLSATTDVPPEVLVAASAACLMLAVKQEESCVMTASMCAERAVLAFGWHVAPSAAQVLAKESELLQLFQWRTHICTSYHFLEMYAAVAGAAIAPSAAALLEQSFLHYELAACAPALVAAAVLAADGTVAVDAAVTGYDLAALAECMGVLRGQRATESGRPACHRISFKIRGGVQKRTAGMR